MYNLLGDIMNKKLSNIGILSLLGLFLIFYIVANFLLEKRDVKDKKEIDANKDVIKEQVNNDKQIAIINRLYSDVRILYDVVNNKFKVSQDDVIVIGDITYKKITNFDEVMNNLFTEQGRDKYLDDFSNYFAYTDNGYYLAGNLVSYQTYYFRGDKTNIFVTSYNDTEINGIIYEKWSSNNKNTLATIRVVNVDNKWLIDDITILAKE